MSISKRVQDKSTGHSAAELMAARLSADPLAIDSKKVALALVRAAFISKPFVVIKGGK